MSEPLEGPPVTPPPDPMGQLTEGYKAFREWTEAMARAGKPLPPGGVCLVTRRGIFVARLLDLRRVIADELHLPPDAVVVELDTHPLTRQLTPRIDVNLPDGYLPTSPVVVLEGKSAGDMAREHARGVIAEFYKRFVADVNDRLASMARSERPDLLPAVEDLLDQEADSGGHADPPSPS